MMSEIRLFNQDCIEAMRGMKDKAYSLAIVDPPYGIKQDGHRENNRSKLANTRKYNKALWDQKRPTKQFFMELERISENQIIWGGNHLADLICRKSSCWIVWDKFTSGGFADCELAYTSFGTAVRKFSYPWNGMIQGFHGIKSKNEDRIHPTQKPVALYKWLLTNYAKPSDKILDTHGGSMSIAIACHDLGFDLDLYEIDADYFKAGKERLERHQRQQTLFAPEELRMEA